MGYSEPTFNVTLHADITGDPASGVGLGTVTASATQTYTGTLGSQVNGTFRMPVFKTPTAIQNLRVYCTGAAGAGVTGINFNFLNGTSTVGSSTAPAVGTWADVALGATVLDSHGVVITASSPTYFTGSNGEMTMLNSAIGTASGSSLGSYAVELTWRNLFVV